jgi:precorrin-2/cobalt-factor-2 C20-methyltransferase
MRKGKITGIALGPGDPELITIKAMKALKEADVIYCAGSESAAGRRSFAAEILAHYELGTIPIKAVYLPMSLNREAASILYAQAVYDMGADCKAGKKVVFAAEGDISFYSTFAYLTEGIKATGAEFSMVPGVPAFISAGAEWQQAITSQADSLAVISQCRSIAQLEKACISNQAVVLMKPTTIKAGLPAFLSSYKGSFVYAENLGRSNQFITSSCKELENREIPYFSLFIFRQ